MLKNKKLKGVLATPLQHSIKGLRGFLRFIDLLQKIIFGGFGSLAASATSLARGKPKNLQKNKPTVTDFNSLMVKLASAPSAPSATVS